ncbi:MAG: DUF4836 family protein [Candidatus Aminicenantes bacterium]|nr:DUF4836 family protein [Candidatus Aminicenantes bacterium]
MKKLLILSITIALLFPMSCVKKEQDGLSALVPSETQLFLKTSSLSSLHQNLSITENSILGKTIPNISSFEAEFGFNPLKLEDLKAQGIDINRSLGFILSDIDIDLTEKKNPDLKAQGMLFFPVSDYEKCMEFIKETIQKFKPEFEIDQRENRTVIYPDKGEKSIIFARKNNYMIVTADFTGNDSNSLLDAVMSGGPVLSENTNFQNVASKIDKENSFFIYLDTQHFLEKFLLQVMPSIEKISEEHGNQITKGLEFAKDCISTGVSINLESSDFRVESMVTLKPESMALKIKNDAEFNKDLLLGIDAAPLLLISQAFDLSEYLNIYLETLPPQKKEFFDETIKEFHTQIGINLKEDLIDNMAGNFNIGIFDGKSLSTTNTNALISITIKDEIKARRLMETLVERLPEEKKTLIRKEKVAGTDAYTVSAGFFQVFLGIKNNNIFITTEKPMFETIVAGKPSSGFISNIQDKKVAEILAGDYDVFYVNVDELLKLYQSSADSLGFLAKVGQKIIDVASHFEYLLIYTSLEGNAMYGEFIMKTRFDKPFIQRIMDFVGQIKN